MSNLSKNTFKAAVALILVLVFGTSISSARGLMCGNRDALMRTLIQKYDERPQGVGLSTSNEVAMEFFTSAKGTWTITMTMTNGKTCIIAAGHSWQTTAKQQIGAPT